MSTVEESGGPAGGWFNFAQATFLGTSSDAITSSSKLLPESVEASGSKIDEELFSHAKAIEELKLHFYGGIAGDAGVVGDLQRIIDGMRRDINKQMELVVPLTAQLSQMRNDFRALREEMGQVRQALDVKGQRPTEAGNATSPLALPAGDAARSSELHVLRQEMDNQLNVLKQRIALLKLDFEISVVKSGFLAVACTECSVQERVQIFSGLKSKQQAIMSLTGSQQERRSEEFLSLPIAMDDANISGSIQSTPTLPVTQKPGKSPGIFNVSFNRPDGKALGVEVDLSQKTVLITDIQPGGLIAEWNAGHPLQEVSVGDEILSANGVSSDPEAILGETARSGVLKLTIACQSRHSL